MKENTTQRLFQQLHQDDQPNYRRASGRCRCIICGEEYRNHPYYDEHTYWGYPVDHRICDGDVVHL